MHVSNRLNALLAGRYEVEREIGAGGMATVYLARDLRHDRRVALKLLRPELASVLGPERFLSEIKVTANLQHPHLLPLFDSGEVEGQLFYVMPYVEGETLRHRLERERQLPVEEAVRVGAAVASALDYAHRHGVIHRDLKPENILLHEGEPLVTDFGIALAVSVAGGERVTQTGLSLGTPQYMSPEQATGDRQIDARSDIYSLGAVVYEMLTGEPPHIGATVQAVIARVLTERPHSVRVQRPSVPPHLDAAVQKALEKLPADRFASAGELGEALTGERPIATNGGYAAGSLTDTRSRQAAGQPGRESVADARNWGRVVGVAFASAAVGFAVAMGVLPWRSPPPRVERYVLSAPPSAPAMISPNQPDVAISPDGARVAYITGSPALLYVRAIDEVEGRPLRGTEGAFSPVFSPDGNWIAYVAGGFLRKISVLGGPPVTLSQASSNALMRGVSWGSDDTIVLATIYLTYPRQGHRFRSV
jgi:serine/threonine-protein kinase